MEFLKAAPDGLAIAVEELGDVANPAVSKFAGFDRGVETAIEFAQGLKDRLHGPFDIERIVDEHGNILPVLSALLGGRRRLPCKSRARKVKWGS